MLSQVTVEIVKRSDQVKVLLRETNVLGEIALVFLPPYAPDRNPCELVWKHLKTDTVRRMAVTSTGDFAGRVRRAMRDLQNDTRKIRSFFQKPSLKYAAWI